MPREKKPGTPAKPAAGRKKTAGAAAAAGGESAYTPDQIREGYRAFGYPKVITLAAIRRDGGKTYTHQEAKKVIDAFARRDPLKGVK